MREFILRGGSDRGIRLLARQLYHMTGGAKLNVLLSRSFMKTDRSQFWWSKKLRKKVTFIKVDSTVERSRLALHFVNPTMLGMDSEKRTHPLDCPKGRDTADGIWRRTDYGQGRLTVKSMQPCE